MRCFGFTSTWQAKYWRCGFNRTHYNFMCATKVAPPMFHVKHSLSLAEGGRGWIVMLSEAKHLVIASECNERGNQQCGATHGGLFRLRMTRNSLCFLSFWTRVSEWRISNDKNLKRCSLILNMTKETQKRNTICLKTCRDTKTKNPKF